MNDLLEQIKLNLIAGRVDKEDEGFDGNMTGLPGVKELVESALNKDIPAVDIFTKSLNPGMQEVGRLYEEGEYLTPDMLAASECIKQAMPLLKPHLIGEQARSKGKFLICTVQGDLHDIGKDIVATMLMGAGYEIIDMGTDVSADKVVETLIKTKAPYLGLSALLTSTMFHMEKIIAEITKKGLRNNVKILIGGAPVTNAFAEKIGADYYCQDAFDAINKLNSSKERTS
jgi:5-methyltetrahydrofolate--homocysteine methyltransferase